MDDSGSGTGGKRGSREGNTVGELVGALVNRLDGWLARAGVVVELGVAFGVSAESLVRM